MHIAFTAVHGLDFIADLRTELKAEGFTFKYTKSEPALKSVWWKTYLHGSDSGYGDHKRNGMHGLIT